MFGEAGDCGLLLSIRADAGKAGLKDCRAWLMALLNEHP